MAGKTALTCRRDPLVRQFRAQALPRIIRTFGPSEVWIFGSRVRGDAMMESDLDVVVVAPCFEGVSWPERGARVLLEAGITTPVEPLCYTPAEFQAKRNDLGIVNAAVSEGLRIYAKRRTGRRPRSRPGRRRSGDWDNRRGRLTLRRQASRPRD
jgi:hypothetical protein